MKILRETLEHAKEYADDIVQDLSETLNISFKKIPQPGYIEFWYSSNKMNDDQALVYIIDIRDNTEGGLEKGVEVMLECRVCIMDTNGSESISKWTKHNEIAYFRAYFFIKDYSPFILEEPTTSDFSDYPIEDITDICKKIHKRYLGKENM